ncbi:MAG: DUF5611 family protein, partial [Euryarchaeota archaeon]|nr:DUF5611 family protein [Euryarchaeota archaeon]
MERFDVKRGMVKQIIADGGLAVLAKKYFEVVNDNGNNSFSGSHDIMTSIESFIDESGALVVNVTNVPPNFEDPDAMKIAQDSRRRWTQFLDDVTGYNSKQRGDKAKEWAKKASKAKSAVSQAKHFMKISSNVSEETR